MSKRVVKYIKKKYNVEPEEIWMKYPNRHAFRHLDNNKTFAVVADTPNNESVIGLKISEPLLRELLLQQDGYGLCCFMPKMTWISVTLNGLVSFEDVCRWIDSSFMDTASLNTFNKYRKPKVWLLPSNPKYFDLMGAFDESDILTWTSCKSMKNGDIVYFYVSAPVSSIMFVCNIVETEVPFTVFDSNSGEIVVLRVMKVQLVGRFDQRLFSFDRLSKEYDVGAIRGPRGIPEKLRIDLEKNVVPVCFLK